EPRDSGCYRAFVRRNDKATFQSKRDPAPVLLECPAIHPDRSLDDRVRLEVIRSFGATGAAQISRRSDQHALDAAESARGSRRVVQRSKAEGNVHALGNKCLPLIIDQQHHAQLGVTREKLPERATRTKTRKADMRSVIESSIHSLDKYILVYPGLYWPSHHGCTFECSPMPPKRFCNEVPRSESGCERVSRTVRQTYLSWYEEHKT